MCLYITTCINIILCIVWVTSHWTSDPHHIAVQLYHNDLARLLSIYLWFIQNDKGYHLTFLKWKLCKDIIFSSFLHFILENRKRLVAWMQNNYSVPWRSKIWCPTVRPNTNHFQINKWDRVGYSICGVIAQWGSNIKLLSYPLLHKIFKVKGILWPKED